MSTSGEMDSEFANFMVMMIVLVFTLLFMRTCVHAGELSRMRQSTRMNNCFPVPSHVAETVSPKVLKSLTFTHLHQLYRSQPHSKAAELESLQLHSDVVCESVQVKRRSERSTIIKTMELEVRSVSNLDHACVQIYWGVSPDTITRTVYANGSVYPTKNKKKRKKKSKKVQKPADLATQAQSRSGGQEVTIVAEAEDPMTLGDNSECIAASTSVEIKTGGTSDDLALEAPEDNSTTAFHQQNTIDHIKLWSDSLKQGATSSLNVKLQTSSGTSSTNNNMAFSTSMVRVPLPTTGLVFPAVVLLFPGHSKLSSSSAAAADEEKIFANPSPFPTGDNNSADGDKSSSKSGEMHTGSVRSDGSISRSGRPLRVLVEPQQQAAAVLCIIEDTQPRPSSYAGQGETKETVEDSYPLTATAKIAISPASGSKYLLQSMYGLTDTDSFQDSHGIPCCVACMVAPREVLLLPCRHIVLCASCELRVQRCPLCKTNKDSVVRFVSK